MAKNPTTPVIIYNGAAPANNWLYDFMQSPADSISPLTGQQLWDQDVANGGAMWWQGAPSCTSSSYPSPTPCSGSWTTMDATAAQYVFSHLDGMPTYQAEGTPQGYGEGLPIRAPPKTRCIWRAPRRVEVAAVQDGGNMPWPRCLPAISPTASPWATAAARATPNRTPFTSTGGGANCVVNGIMTAMRRSSQRN